MITASASASASASALTATLPTLNNPDIQIQKQQVSRFTSDTETIHLVIKAAKVTSKNCYIISYAFDTASINEIAQELHKNGKSKSLKEIYDLLRDIFIKATGKYYEPGFNGSEVTEVIRLYTCNTKPELLAILNSIKEQLTAASLNQISNIDSIDITNIVDHQSKNHDLFSDFTKLLEESITILFKYYKFFSQKNIILLSHGSSDITCLKMVLEMFQIKINITIADISYSENPKASTDSDSNITVKKINLDNTKKFSEQSLTEKFDLIFMRHGLCYCGITRTEDIPSCAGIKMYRPGELKNFISNVFNIVDTNNPQSMAILEGANFHEPKFWESEIQQFNFEQSGNFTAEIIRNNLGAFRGIMISSSSNYNS
jgi:hypothetical protein